MKSFQVLETEFFSNWIERLRDRRAAARISQRIQRLTDGNAGDVRPVGSGVAELRIDYGPGYRVYFVRTGNVVVVLLCGGDKSTQSRDIKTAQRLAQELKGTGNESET